MRKRSLWLSRDTRAFKPRANDDKVLRFKFVEIVAGDRVEAGTLLNYVSKAVAVCEQHPMFNVIRKSDKRGKFVPSEGRAARSELSLISVVFAELRFKDAIHAFIANG